MTRLETVSAAAGLPAAPEVPVTADSANELAALSTRAYGALMNGDAAAYSDIMKHTRDFTLMQPFGGAVVHGFDMSPQHLARLGGTFRKGDFRQDVVQSICSGDVAVLVTIEHQSVEVCGLARQDWPLRVTLVFHRQDGEWRLAHRHADPLVHGISVERAAALARGDTWA